ncbi:TPA: exonuclease SbcCD subunit D [Enterococcus faecium]
MVKFIHAADLHMDRSFEGLTTLDKTVQEKLLKTNLTVLSNIIEQAIINNVDFVLLAGDNFHQNRPSLKIQKHFSEQMKRLEKNHIPVFIIFGNHDFYQKERYWFSFPKNVHLFTSETVETKKITIKSGETVSLSGFSYRQPWIQKDKVMEFPSRELTDYHIGLYHGEPGVSQKGNYAPFQPSKMQEKGYDYWALGHIHVPTVLNEKQTIVYPGAPQGHTKKEQASTSILLVELSKGSCQIHPIKVAEVYWKTKEISLRKARTTKEVIVQIRQQLSKVEDGFSLIEIKLKDYDHLNTDVLERIQSGELLDYLLEEFSDRINDFFIWRISLIENTFYTKTPLAASAKLMEQLFQYYQTPQDFQQILNEVYSHQEAARILSELPEYQEETLEKAKQLLNQDFLFEEDQE